MIRETPKIPPLWKIPPPYKPEFDGTIRSNSVHGQQIIQEHGKYKFWKRMPTCIIFQDIDSVGRMDCGCPLLVIVVDGTPHQRSHISDQAADSTISSVLLAFITAQTHVADIAGTALPISYMTRTLYGMIIPHTVREPQQGLGFRVLGLRLIPHTAREPQQRPELYHDNPPPKSNVLTEHTCGRIRR